MKAYITKITPWHPDKVKLQWDLAEVTESGTFTFDIERSGSPGGPWTTIASGQTGYTYEDTLDLESANTLSLVRDMYYRVKAIPPSGVPNAVYSSIVNLDGLVEHEIVPSQPGTYERPVPRGQVEPDPDTNLTDDPSRGIDVRLRLIKNKILQDRYLMLKRLNGIEYFLLKRRHFGTRCSCFDPSTSEILYADCSLCHGTGWQDGGYYDPITVLGRRVTSQIQSKTSPQDERDLNFTFIQLLDFPRVEEGDLLVEKAHNRRWLVQQRSETSLKGITVNQTVAVSELPRTAPEYDIVLAL